MTPAETCYLFTEKFPFGGGETFIENEVPILAEHFKKVVIFPMETSAQIRELPSNVFIHTPPDLRKIALTTRDYLTFCSFLPDVLIRLITASLTISELRYIFSLLKNLLKVTSAMESYLDKNRAETAVFYSYWFDNWATVLALLKKRKVISGFHSRAHRFDIYENRRSFGFIPFRKQQLCGASTISSVSHAGYLYFTQKYPQYKDKFKMYRLGVVDRGAGTFDASAQFTMVSCSNLVAVKRVELLIKILGFIKSPIRWIHFGTGPLRENIELQATKLPAHIAVEFKGQVSNATLLEYYQKETVNLFVNTSESEGIPVSIMEAISFGIPVLATAAGGTPEIVGEYNGHLLPVNFDPRAAADWVLDFMNSDKNSRAYRMKVREHWNKHFEAQKNYTAYINEILKKVPVRAK